MLSQNLSSSVDKTIQTENLNDSSQKRYGLKSPSKTVSQLLIALIKVIPTPI